MKRRVHRNEVRMLLIAVCVLEGMVVLAATVFMELYGRCGR